jgi:hypothetical protein
LASFDASIRLRVDDAEVNQRIRQLTRNLSNISGTVSIRASNLERTINTINQLQEAANALQGSFRRIDAPGAGAAGDQFRTAATQANEFVDALFRGERAFARSNAGLAAQSQAFQILSANIGTTEARFTDYVQAAEAASTVDFSRQLDELRAIQRFYQDGLSGRGTEITNQNIGGGLFGQLLRDVPQTEAALKALQGEIRRVTTLVEAGSLAGADATRALLEVEERLLQVEQERALVRNELNPQVQASLGAMTGPSGGSQGGFAGIGGASMDDQINASLDARAQRIQDAIDNAAEAELKARREVDAAAARGAEEQARIRQRFLDDALQAELASIDDIAQRELRASDAVHKRELRQFDERLKRRVAGIEEAARAEKEAQERNKRVRDNLALGVGFPLLFGGGAGSVLGGALGGLFDATGKGFAGQILFSALGQLIDTAAQEAAAFTVALRETGDGTEYLEKRLGNLEPALERTIENLAESGQVTKAAEASFKVLSDAIGDNLAKELVEAGENTEEFNKKVSKFFTYLQAQGARTLNLLLEIADAWDRVTGNAPGIDLANLPAEPDPSGLNTDAKNRIEDQAAENSLLQQRLALTQAQSSEDASLVYQRERMVALQEYANTGAKLERELAQNKITQQLYTLQLKEAELRLQTDLISAQTRFNKEQRQQAEEAARAAEKRAREQEAAQRKAEEAYRKQLATMREILSLESELIKVTLAAADIDVQEIELTKGKNAAVAEQIQQLQDKLDLEARALQIETQSKLLQDDLTEKERSLVEAVYKQKLANLEREYQLKQRSLQVTLAELEAQTKIEELRGPRDIQDINRERGGELKRNQAKLANPFGGDKLDTTNLLLDQEERRLQALIPLQRELEDLKIERAEKAASASEYDLALLDRNIYFTEQKLKLEQQWLNQLDASEQAMLRQQQIMDKYGFIAEELSTAMSDAITNVITGTGTVAEAFSRMFANIGKAFIDMATQMLAQKLFLTVANALGGALGGAFGSGGGGFSGAGPYQFPSMGSYSAGFTGSMNFFADGGFVTGPTPAVVGEAGNEYIIPAGKMGEAMNRYAAGRRGSGVIPDSSAPGSGGAGGGGHFTLETVVINNVEYATVEQVRAMGRYSAQQGAAGGHSRVMGDLRNKRSVRSRMGLA